MLGYMSFALLILSTVFLVVAVDAYSDVDLRIAERKAIPHYIRHGYEYPDIDIKAIMAQRGIPIPSPGRQFGNRPSYNRVQTNYNQPALNRNVFWRTHNKSFALNNHVLPQQNRYFLKKARFYQNSLADKSKMKNKY